MTDQEKTLLYDELGKELTGRVVKDVTPQLLSAVEKRFADLTATVKKAPPDFFDMAGRYIQAVYQRDKSAYEKLRDDFPEQFRAINSTSTGVSYAMPTGIGSYIIKKMDERYWHRQLCTVLPTTENSGQWPVAGTACVANRPASEVTAATESAPTFGTLAWDMEPLAAKLIVSDRLLKVTIPETITFLLNRLAFAMGTQEFQEVVTGAGTNEWDGLETGWTSTYAELPGNIMGTLNGTYYTLTDGYQNSPNCRWVMKRATLGWIHANAIDSAGRPMFDQGKVLDTIMGIPVVTNSNVTAGKVMLGDLSYFWIFQGADWGLRTTNEGINLADTAQTMFVMRQENDGRVALAESGVYTTLTIV